MEEARAGSDDAVLWPVAFAREDAGHGEGGTANAARRSFHRLVEFRLLLVAVLGASAVYRCAFAGPHPEGLVQGATRANQRDRKPDGEGFPPGFAAFARQQPGKQEAYEAREPLYLINGPTARVGFIDSTRRMVVPPVLDYAVDEYTLYA